MPSDLVFKAGNVVHRTLLRVTGGRLGRGMAGMPVLELVTTGRRTGKPRAVMLTVPVREGDGYVVVASRGGDDKHPAWFLNLRDRPTVQVSVQGGPHVPMVASIIGPDDRARMWPAVVAQFPNYGRYQERTRREIPLVLLRPAPEQP